MYTITNESSPCFKSLKSLGRQLPPCPLNLPCWLKLLCFSSGVFKKKKKAKGKLLQKPGESTRKFFDRLDAQVGEALNKALMETKQLRVKRKEYVIIACYL